MVQEPMELSAGCVDGVLFGLGDSRPDQWPAVFFDQARDELVDRELFEARVRVATADEFAADLPQVAQVAIEGRFGYLAAQQVEQERLEGRDDGAARCQVRRLVLPAQRPVLQIWTGLRQQSGVRR